MSCLADPCHYRTDLLLEGGVVRGGGFGDSALRGEVARLGRPHARAPGPAADLTEHVRRTASTLPVRYGNHPRKLPGQNRIHLKDTRHIGQIWGTKIPRERAHSRGGHVPDRISERHGLRFENLPRIFRRNHSTFHSIYIHLYELRELADAGRDSSGGSPVKIDTGSRSDVSRESKLYTHKHIPGPNIIRRLLMAF